MSSDMTTRLPSSTNVAWHHATITRARRETQNGRRGFAGLSGSGKSTLAHAIKKYASELFSVATPYLTYTAEGLKRADPQFRWLDAIEQNAGLTERLDAFVSRFCRLKDTLGDKLLPAYLTVMASLPPLIMKLAMTVSPYPTFPRRWDNQRLGCGRLQPSRMASCFTQKGQTNRYASFMLSVQLEPVGTVLGNLNRAEKLGLISSVADWIETRSIRNNLVREYTEYADMLRQGILRALELIPMLENAAPKLCQTSINKA